MPPDAPEKIEIAAAAEPAVAAAAVPAAEPAAPAAGDPSRTSAASEVPAKDAGTTEPIIASQSEPSLLQTFDADKKAKEAKPAEAKPAEAKPADPAKPAEAKPAEPAKDATAKPEEAKPVEAAKPEPIEYKYTLPESITIDDKLRGQLHEALDKFRADPAAGVQGLIDLHNNQILAFSHAADQNQRRVFNEYRAENRKAVMADPEIGGSGHQTAMGAIARMRDMLAPKGSLEPRKFDDGKPRLSEFDEFLESTGAGDHPLFLKILHNVARYLDEPQASQLPANPRPARVRAPKGGIYSEESRAKMNGK